MQEPLSFGTILKAYRKARDLTQAELAVAANCGLETLRKVEADRHRPSRELSEGLASALRIPEQEWPEFIRRARQLPEESAVVNLLHHDAQAIPGQIARLLAISQDILAGSSEVLLSEACCILGRHPSCNVIVKAYIERENSEKVNVVSRRHAKIERDGPRFLLYDTGSLNGTYVNRQKLEGPHLLVHYDQIGLGSPEPILIFFDPDPTARVE